MKSMIRLVGSCSLVALLLLSVTHAQAQESAGIGADMWVGQIKSRSMFIPHNNFCDSGTEAFVSVSPQGEGFCIEKNERTAAEWEDARHDCVNDNKRLPEIAEYKYACDAAGTLSLSGMTDDWEWASNFTMMMSGADETDDTIGVAMMGNGGCNRASSDPIGRYISDSAVPYTRPYRCVR